MSLSPSTSSAQLRLGVIGGGSFGTILSHIMQRNKHQVSWWLRDKTKIKYIRENNHNPDYLTKLDLAPGLILCESLKELADNSDIIFFVIPSFALVECAKELTKYLQPHHKLINAAKGVIEPDFGLISDFLNNHLKQKYSNSVGVLCGPNIAKELADKHLSGTVIASKDQQLRADVRAALNSQFFRVFENKDVRGVELGGVLKNIYAIAAGIIDALQMGVNSKSLLIVRGSAEIMRFAVKYNANELTFLGLAGMGDLIATCFSADSRNYQLGFCLGQGMGLEQSIKSLSGVAEGMNTLKQLNKKTQELNVDMPLANGLYQVIFEGRSVQRTLWGLLDNTPIEDIEFSH